MSSKWEWEADWGWKEFDFMPNKVIEESWEKELPDVGMSIGNHYYSFDLINMKQKNTYTETERRIRRKNGYARVPKVTMCERVCDIIFALSSVFGEIDQRNLEQNHWFAVSSEFLLKNSHFPGWLCN